MPNRATMIADRATAGAAYAAAATAYVNAWVELAAQDASVCGKIIAGGLAAPFGNLPDVLSHGDFLPRSTRDALASPNVVSPAVTTRTVALLASWTGS